MKWKFGLLCGLLNLPILASADDTIMQFSISSSTYVQQNMLVRIVTQYPSDEPQVEFKFQEALADRNVDSGSFAELFASSAAPSAMIQTLKQQAYSTYLCVWPRKTVQWDPAVDAAAPADPLETFLGQNLAYNPTNDTTDLRNTRQITKFNAVVYDVNSGKGLWRGIVEVAAAEELRTYWYDKELKTKVLAYLTYAGLIPR